MESRSTNFVCFAREYRASTKLVLTGGSWSSDIGFHVGS